MNKIETIQSNVRILKDVLDILGHPSLNDEYERSNVVYNISTVIKWFEKFEAQHTRHARGQG